jgi:hypothetical protein
VGGVEVPAACETANTRFAIAIVPLRAAPVLAATVNVTVPFPLPVAPDVTAIQGTVLPADQAHPGGDVTAIGVPAPPAAPMLSDVGAMVAPQFGVGVGAAAP